MSRRRLAAVLAAAGLAAATVGAGGCGDGDDGGEGVRVVATTTHAADLARAVGGERVAVRGLLRPGADPHGYEPRPSDARALAESSVVLRMGGEVDDWLEDLAEQAPDGARELDLGRAAGAAAGPDPHWWLDPRNVSRATGALAQALAAADPAGRATYERRARGYRRALAALDREIARCLALVPAGRRKLVASHESLGWLARRYGLEVIGAVIPSRSSAGQPSAGEVQRLAGRIRDEGARAIFPESALDSELERAVAREAGVRVGRPLYTDALGAPGSDGATYLDAMASNAERLVEGLTGGERSCAPRARG